MYCAKCGKQIADGAHFCPSCGTATNGDAIASGLPDGVVKGKGGCGKGCLIAVFVMVVIGALLILMIGYTASESQERELSAMAASSKVTDEEAARNGEDLVAWIRNKSGQTEIARNDAFAKLKGKTVLLRGKVREIGKTTFSDEVFVSLTVGQLSVLERINVQFNVRESCTDKVKTWNRDEVHVMRGRISGQGDLNDDAVCDIAEIVE